MKSILILGSAPDAPNVTKLNLANFDKIIAINNAWLACENWTHSIFPDDFDTKLRPTPMSAQTLVQSSEYVPANNQFGGIIYAGGTMAFSAAYWALDAFKADMMVFYGCDMVYDSEETHFYGKGTADPLRDDPTLQSLEAKANRLLLMAANHGCLCANASEKFKSRLTFPKITAQECDSDPLGFRRNAMTKLQQATDKSAMEKALSMEAKYNCFAPTGDYWKSPELIDPQKLAKIDALWLKSFTP